jgi:hypothetical protein
MVSPRFSRAHLVGGPPTIETFRALGAFNKLGLVLLPFFLRGGTQLIPALSTGSRLTVEEQRALPEGAVEIVYAC